ncbi:MAG: DUF4388 domain-containing protein, partial [Thermoanaerobaculia bacterium]
VEKKIFFKEGEIASTAASDPKEYLGHFLVSHGYIDEESLAKAMGMQEENRMLLGKILVTIGAISEADLDRMLKLKARESIYDLFTWKEGEFHFYDDELPEYTMVPLSLGVTHLVLEGHRRIDEWAHMREKIPSPHAVPVAVGQLKAPADDPGAGSILALVDDDRTIHEIALQTHSSEFFVYSVLYQQLELGRLKVVRPRKVPEEVAPARQMDSESLVRKASGYLAEKSYHLALRHLQAARSLEPDNQKALEAVTELEQRIAEEIEAEGVVDTSIPQLTAPVEELDSTGISPQAGFILTRINGTYDIQTILKISPMPPLDAKVVFWSLQSAGHIRLEEP